MQSDLAGRVRNTALGTANALLPLFEAVANSVDAIDEAEVAEGRIDITIDRHPTLLPARGDDANTVPDVAGFSIRDNGVGFVERHYLSFETLDTLAKEPIGGKGVGRLLWLVAFEWASVESEYVEDGATWTRRFEFRRTTAGVENEKKEGPRAAIADNSTTVRLIGFRKKYAAAAPKTARAIAKRTIEHFLVLYMLKTMPRVVVHDPATSTSLDLSSMYAEEFEKSASTRTFQVGNETFEIIDLMLRPTSEAENALHFCANRRVVKSIKLASWLPHAEGAFKSDGEAVLYAACITGDLLDNSVDAQRTDFRIDREGDFALSGSSVTWEQIMTAAVGAAAEFLRPQMQDAREKSVARIRKFVEEEEPRYRILLEHKTHEIAEIPGNLTDEKLEIELHRRLSTWRQEAKADATKKLKALPDDPEDFAVYEAGVLQALGELQEVAKADLADYVVHRRTVLDFFEKLLGRLESGQFSREDALHGLFFPLRSTSNEVDYEDHNLWILDERLAFHHYLASDIPLASQKHSPLKVDAITRPDVLIYNKKMAFAAEDYRPFSSVVVVEFKRPERDDYEDDDNPVTQVYGYVKTLRDGTAKNRDGASVDRVESNVPFFCHVVASLTKNLRRQLEFMDFTPGPDGQSYFTFNKNVHAYVEVSSYARILQDAVKRNKAFFEKLHLPTGMRRI